MFSTNTSLIARPELIIGFAPPIIALSALVGGAASNLDGLDVDTLNNGYILGASIGDELTFWRVRARADGEEEDGQAFVLPDGDAERVWVRVL